MKKNITWESYHYDFDEIKSGECKEKKGYDDDDDDEAVDKLDKVIQTPFGVFKLDDCMNPFKQFNMWIGHTNFHITRKVAEQIEETEGIEILRVISPYRFIMAVARLFDNKEVRIELEKKLCGKHIADTLIKSIEDIEVRKQVINLKTELTKSAKYWSIYVFPNGVINHIKANELTSEFNEQFTQYVNAQTLSNGILLISEAISD